MRKNQAPAPVTTPDPIKPSVVEKPQDVYRPNTPPSAPVQKQYGVSEPSPEPISEPEPVHAPEDDEKLVPESKPIVAAKPATSIQDGADRRSLGLSALEEESVTEESPVVIETEDRVSALINRSQEGASEAGYAPVSPATKPAEETPKEQPRRQPRRISKAKRNNQMNKHNSRARRLNRSRHMEYKYEMRALLKEIEVGAEHHSVLLGTIWAKGERQDVKSAKDFVRERKDAGAINDEQMDRLLSLIDDYTTRR